MTTGARQAQTANPAEPCGFALGLRRRGLVLLELLPVLVALGAGV